MYNAKLYLFGYKTGFRLSPEWLQIIKTALWNFAIIRVLHFLFNPKGLDPSYKTDLDFWNCFGRKNLRLITEEKRQATSCSTAEMEGKAMVKNLYNRIPHLAPNINWERKPIKTKQSKTRQAKDQLVSPFPADHHEAILKIPVYKKRKKKQRQITWN